MRCPSGFNRCISASYASECNNHLQLNFGEQHSVRFGLVNLSGLMMPRANSCLKERIAEYCWGISLLQQNAKAHTRMVADLAVKTLKYAKSKNQAKVRSSESLHSSDEPSLGWQVIIPGGQCDFLCPGVNCSYLYTILHIFPLWVTVISVIFREVRLLSLPNPWQTDWPRVPSLPWRLQHVWGRSSVFLSWRHTLLSSAEESKGPTFCLCV